MAKGRVEAILESFTTPAHLAAARRSLIDSNKESVVDGARKYIQFGDLGTIADLLLVGVEGSSLRAQVMKEALEAKAVRKRESEEYFRERENELATDYAQEADRLTRLAQELALYVAQEGHT